MAKRIGRTTSFPEVKGLDQEFNQLIKQIAHKDDVLIKNNINADIVFYASLTSGGATDLKVSASSVNGQITKLEVV